MAAADHALERFVDAQAPVYDQVRAELARGRKASHWMWFVFPQLRGLGSSPMAQHFGLTGRDEAGAYWRHPLLGPRLAECCGLLLAVDGRSADEVMGTVDAMKLRSCMTLFDAAVADAPVFAQVLARYFDGGRDPRTLSLLAGD